MGQGHTSVDITKIKKDAFFSIQDEIIREIPLQIRVNGFPCATLMRTPGQDRELALGFCFTEGILPDSWKEGALQWEERCPHENCIDLRLEHLPSFRPGMNLTSPLSSSPSHPSSTSSLSSASSIPSASPPSSTSSPRPPVPKSPPPPGPPSWTDSVETPTFMETPTVENPLMEVSGDETEIVNRIFPSLGSITCQFHVPLSTLRNIEGQAREKQALFALTGSTHAALIFDSEGNYLFCFEDMARHNALDKAIGHALLTNEDLSDKILFLSGRTNFTLIRKAARSRIPVVASISAPTSLAVSLSKRVGMTLIGFLRSEGMNIYAGQKRIDMRERIESE